MSQMINSIEKLRGRENYDSWKVAMRAALKLEKLWKNVIEFTDSKTETAPDSDKDEAALARITLCVDKVNYSHIVQAKSAKDAWDSLASAFEDSGLTRKVALLRTLVTCRLENFHSNEEYCDAILTTAQKLNDLKFVVSDEWVGALLLAGLPEDFRPMIMGLENSGTKITADAVKVRILQDVKLDSNRDSESAMLANKRFKSSKPRCVTCNKIGHSTNNCWSKKKYSKPK
uniref:Retrovirus-related Pol polyprotein from transposon TNT 1-94 n=1 Tax=Lygus hesperus TaxID=30085 RepID=A0A0A9Z9B6_LYGHE